MYTKTRFNNIENALDLVDQLSGFYYQANQTAADLGYEVKREIGVSAQEVQKVLPEIVAPAPISDKYLTVRYEKFAPLLIEAIKELRREINNIKQEIIREIFKVEEKYEKKIQAIKQETQQTVQSMLNQFLKS